MHDVTLPQFSEGLRLGSRSSKEVRQPLKRPSLLILRLSDEAPLQEAWRILRRGDSQFDCVCVLDLIRGLWISMFVRGVAKNLLDSFRWFGATVIHNRGKR